jgi:hypothetical protein
VSTDTEQRRHRPAPRGAYPADNSAATWLRVLDIKIRRRRQAEGDPPMFARARFGWSMGEVSGLARRSRNVPPAHRGCDHRRPHGPDRHQPPGINRVVIKAGWALASQVWRVGPMSVASGLERVAVGMQAPRTAAQDINGRLLHPRAARRLYRPPLHTAAYLAGRVRLGVCRGRHALGALFRDDGRVAGAIDEPWRTVRRTGHSGGGNGAGSDRLSNSS